jgi:hypothetical protein
MDTDGVPRPKKPPDEHPVRVSKEQPPLLRSDANGRVGSQLRHDVLDEGHPRG